MRLVLGTALGSITQYQVSTANLIQYMHFYLSSTDGCTLPCLTTDSQTFTNAENLTILKNE